MSVLSKRLLSESQDMLLALGVIGILLVLFTPIPTALLDLLLLTNFTIALLILLVTFDTDKPLSFSTFPSLLLMTTLFRLAMNIAATRMILTDGDAAQVISAVGTHVVGGNYVVGFVVFLILVVVQYVVVTSGAQRVAEVAARFTLDSLPGKQMSIDADLNMGIIDQDEAKRRRSQLERESNFYGAMDGASKFVKGDAIAGIIIIAINIIGGLAVGMLQHGMSWGEALQHYTLLTVGDGIVTQIPSLIIAVAAGIIITRAATDSRLGQELGKQLSTYPKMLVVVALVTLLLMSLPGLPVLPLACYIKDGQAAQERTQSIIDGYIIESEDLDLNEIANIASDMAMGYFIELDSGDSSICNPADVYESTQMIDATTALIALLPDNQRQVIAGHYLHGLSFVEISGLMEISKSRVSQLHNRVLKEMRGLHAKLNSS